MEIRESLISDIKSFLLEAEKIYNAEKIVKKSEYLNLEKRISSLNKDNFESEEKYKYFLNYFNQEKRRVEKNLFEHQLKEEYIKNGKFLWMCNYFSGIVDWLK